MKAIAALAILSTSVLAADEPAYWMKKYPGADPAKVQKCLAVAQEAYDKAVSDTSWGQNGWAVLAKGNAWEKCMESK